MWTMNILRKGSSYMLQGLGFCQIFYFPLYTNLPQNVLSQEILSYAVSSVKKVFDMHECRAQCLCTHYTHVLTKMTGEKRVSGQRTGFEVVTLDGRVEDLASSIPR
jgi:hypothetical protein